MLGAAGGGGSRRMVYVESEAVFVGITQKSIRQVFGSVRSPTLCDNDEDRVRLFCIHLPPQRGSVSEE